MADSKYSIFTWILFFSVGWVLVAPALASYEAGINQGSFGEWDAGDYETGLNLTAPSGNAIGMTVGMVDYFFGLFDFETSPTTAFLSTFLFVPLTIVGLFIIVR